MRKLKVVSFSINKGFCYYYRLNYPLRNLEQMGLIEWFDCDQKHPEQMLEIAADCDVIIMQGGSPHKMTQDMQNLIIKNKLIKIIVSEFDDDMFNIDIVNPVYKHFGTEEVWGEGKDGEKHYIYKDGEDEFNIAKNKKGIEEMGKAVIMSDMVTNTTDNLAETFREYNDNVKVVRNCLDFDMMPNQFNKKNKPNSDTVVIAWSGGDSHYADMKRVIPILTQIQDRYGKKVLFRFFGARFDNLYKDLNHEIIPWTAPDKYFETFSELLPDIGIIPLEDTRFNAAKSNIKWLEYSYYGIPSVIENVLPYRGTAKHGSTALMYNDGKQMYDYLVKLIEDPIYRMKLAADARKHVMKKYDIKDEAVRWFAYFLEALGRKKQSYEFDFDNE